MAISKSPSLKPSGPKSSSQGTSVGSGSRPTTGKKPIMTSAPSNPKMIRPAPSPLK